MTIAGNKLKKLQKKYDGFINVFVDNWRGYRFVFDTSDTQKCTNDCQNCPLFLLLKNAKENINSFSTALFKATAEDKRIFGQQNYLNCKTTKQYKKCFVNYLLQNINDKKAVTKELIFIKNFRLIYSKNIRSLKRTENNFKKSIIKKTLIKCDKNQKLLVSELVQRLKIV